MAESALNRRDADGLVAAVVRTPAGAKKYGQPIGSVIKPDVRVVNRAVRAVVVPAPHKGHMPTQIEVKAARSDIDANPDLFRGSAEAAVYLTAAGYNERPTVLSTEAFDAFKGKTISNYNAGPEQLSTFWRGVRSTGSDVDPYTNLTLAKPIDFYVGFGVYSNGTHVGNERSAAKFAYVAGHRIPKTSKRFPEGSSMIRIKIHPDARVVSYDKVPTMADPVEWAVEHGYDVIDLTPTGDTQAGVAVLNRSVMVVEEMLDPIPPKRVFAVGSRVEWGGIKRIQGEVLKNLGDVILVKPPWAGAPLRMSPEKLTQVMDLADLTDAWAAVQADVLGEVGSADEVTGRVASAGAPGEPGLDVSAGGTDDPGLGSLASGLPAEGRSDLPAALGTLDRTLTAAGDSWRWQLRDKNGQWIEMGSEVRYLIRGLYKQGIVVGSPSPGVAKVRENITNLLRDIPSNRLEVVESAARVVERVFDVGEREADLQDNPALRDLVERSKKGEVSFIGWGDWLLPDEFGPLTDTIVDLVSSRVYLGQFKSGNVQAEAGQLVYEQIGPKIQELGFDDDSAWYLSQAIGIRITETIHREKQWGTASDRTKTEIAPNLNEVRRTGQIASAVTAETAKQILADGAFKSQFEVTESKGLYDPVLRTKYETAMFGMHPHMNKRLRAIYGYVYTPGQETSESLDQYGNMRFLLKPEVRSRTTMTAGDSLGTGALPVAMEGPDLTDKEAFMATSAMPRSIGLAASSPKVFQERDYYEAQIHGGVTLDDVQEIVVTLEHRDYYTQKALDEAILLAQQRGIPVRYETPTRYS